jgi:hypothetical protein
MEVGDADEQHAVDVAALEMLERKHLEADWRRAWESCSRAAQSGDYAEAERWHRKALLLASQLTTADRAIKERCRPLALVS